jgi:ribonuclease HI
MTDAVNFAAGGYRFLPSVFQYSAGVAALPGHAIERVRFRAPVPLAEGFARIEQLITAAGRPLTAFCACELRSPAPFTEEGFRAFNEVYVVTLEKWRLFDGKVNPVARSNVCPEIDPPAEPSFHAFSFTVAAADAAPSFVIAGGAGPARFRRSASRSAEHRLSSDHVVLHVDGGARGNPGPAGIGVVLTDADGNELDRANAYIGETTNNVAEYRALILGLDRARALGANELEIVNDSELVAKQLVGTYKVKKEDLRLLHAQARQALEAFERWSIRSVPRAQNEIADALVNEAIDARAATAG